MMLPLLELPLLELPLPPLPPLPELPLVPELPDSVTHWPSTQVPSPSQSVSDVHADPAGVGEAEQPAKDWLARTSPNTIKPLPNEAIARRFDMMAA